MAIDSSSAKILAHSVESVIMGVHSFQQKNKHIQNPASLINTEGKRVNKEHQRKRVFVFSICFYLWRLAEMCLV